MKRSGSEINDFVCFTMKISSGNFVVTMKNIQAFKGMTICVGSHTPHNKILLDQDTTGKKIYRYFQCHDCKCDESKCSGPFDMYHLVHNGLPKVVCHMCWNDGIIKGVYTRYSENTQQKFYQLLNNDCNAEILRQTRERLDTFIVETRQEREVLTSTNSKAKKLKVYLSKRNIFEVFKYDILSICCLQYIQLFFRLLLFSSLRSLSLQASQITI